MNILKLLRWPKPKPVPKAADDAGRFEIALSGSGGQGIVLAGKILAEAASIHEGREAAMTQSYGPEARGGASRVDVIISSASIEYPKAIHTNILLAMTQEAVDKYAKTLEAGDLLVVDETLIKSVPGNVPAVFKAPFTGTAIKLLNARIVANIIALGALAALTKVVSREALIRALIARVPVKVLALNRIALDAGFKVAVESGFRWEAATRG